MTGSTLVKDPKTGFLTHSAEYKREGFTIAMKEKVLEYLKQEFHLSNAAKFVGIARRTLELHLQLDEEFARRVDEIRDSECDSLEVRVLEEGKKKSFMDRIAWLRAHRPEKWGDRKSVVHSIDKSALDFLHKKSEAIEVKNLATESSDLE